MRYRFVDCELDMELCELRRGGTVVGLRAKVFQLLVYLLEQHQRVVRKDELLDQLWAGRIVSETTLTSCIKAARRAVGDDGERQQVIQTVRGLGYRFVAEIQEQSPEAETSPEVKPKSPPVQAEFVPTRVGDRAPYTLGREHKQVSVLCAGVVSAPALAARLGPEAMDHLMQGLFARAEQAVARYEGVITQRQGDGLMALFGAPRAHDDDARRAVLAALELLELMYNQPDDNGQPLELGLGVHNGPVVVGGLVSAPGQIYTALGITTEVALRLQQQAAPGTLLISDTSYRLVAGEVKATQQGALEDAPVALTVYLVDGIRRRVAGVPQRQGQMLTRFIGRERELAMLRERSERARTGAGQVVGLMGEPGIGKSRLLYEFRRRLGDAHCFEGHCLSYGHTTPYLPLKEIVRQCCGIAADESGDVVAAKVTHTLQDKGIATPAQPLLLQLLDMPVDTNVLARLDPQQRRAQTFAYLRHLLQARVQHQSGVLVLEDAHWIDATSEEWLDELVTRLPGIPLLVLVSYRPGYRPGWLERAAATQLALAPLLPRDSESLVQEITPALRASPTLVQTIIAKAQGNPFFLEELGWTLAQRETAQKIPDTVQAVVATRIDQLADEDKWRLQTAAVVGTAVPLALLEDLEERRDEGLHVSLGRLQASEFLYEKQADPEVIYRFKHALTRDVAYQSLLSRDRRDLHRKIAERLERRLAHRDVYQPEVLAHHFTEAGLLRQAAAYWHRAGKNAVERSALLEATEHFGKGLTLLRQLPDSHERSQRELALLIDLGILLQNTKGAASTEVEQTYTQARELGHRVGDASQRFAVLWGLWRLYTHRAELRNARELANELLDLAEQANDTNLRLEARHAQWSITHYMGEFISCREHIEAGIALVAQQESPQLSNLFGGHDAIVCAQGSGATVLWLLGYPEQSARISMESLRRARALDHNPTLANALTNAIEVHLLSRNIPDLQKAANELVGLASKQGFEAYLAEGTIVEGWLLIQQNRTDQGLARMKDAIASFRSTGYDLYAPFYLVLLAQAYGKTGQPKSALDILNESSSIMNAWPFDYWGWGEVHRLTGEVLLSVQPEEQAVAESHFKAAIDIACRQRAKSMELRASMSLAGLWQQQKRDEDARSLLAPIYNWFTEGFDTRDLQQAKALLRTLAGRDLRKSN